MKAIDNSNHNNGFYENIFSETFTKHLRNRRIERKFSMSGFPTYCRRWKRIYYVLYTNENMASLEADWSAPLKVDN